MSLGSPSGAPASTHRAIRSICCVGERPVVLELLDPDGPVDVPRRHLSSDDARFDGPGPRARLGKCHQRHRRDVAGAMARLTLVLQDRRDVDSRPSGQESPAERSVRGDGLPPESGDSLTAAASGAARHSRGRPVRYGPMVVGTLRRIWEAAGYPGRSVCRRCCRRGYPGRCAAGRSRATWRRNSER